MNLLSGKSRNAKLFIIAFAFIPVLLLLVFVYYPALKLLIYSFTDFDGLSDHLNFVGLRNWKQLLKGDEVWKTLLHSVYYIIGGVLQNILAIILAVILNNRRIKGRNIFRGLIVLPFILNGTAVSYLFRYFFDYSKGPLNLLLNFLGLQSVSWLGNETIVNWSLAFVCMWRYTGYIMIIYLAALQSIPSEYYEAAMIDGCSSVKQFIYISYVSALGEVGACLGNPALYTLFSGSSTDTGEPFFILSAAEGSNSLTYIVVKDEAETPAESHTLGISRVAAEKIPERFLPASANLTVTNVEESTADGGSNVVTFSDGKTLTVKNGTKGLTGAAGAKGEKGDKGDTGAAGAKGDKGDTPVKGTDYFTAEDRAELVADVLAALPDGDTEVYGT